jgi:hypothetical protein
MLVPIHEGPKRTGKNRPLAAEEIVLGAAEPVTAGSRTLLVKVLSRRPLAMHASHRDRGNKATDIEK